MLLILLFVALIVIGICMIIYSNSSYNDLVGCIGIFIGTLGFVCLIICIILLIVGHCAVDNRIVERKIEHDGIVKQIELLKKEDGSISSNVVIDKVSEWNRDVRYCKYWSNNIWTNWFFDKRYVDSLEYIEIGVW